MPDSLCEDSGDTPSAATVRRTHSDSRKRENTADDMDKLRVGSKKRKLKCRIVEKKTVVQDGSF